MERRVFFHKKAPHFVKPRGEFLSEDPPLWLWEGAFFPLKSPGIKFLKALLGNLFGKFSWANFENCVETLLGGAPKRVSSGLKAPPVGAFNINKPLLGVSLETGIGQNPFPKIPFLGKLGFF